MITICQSFDDPANVWVGSGLDGLSGTFLPVVYYIEGDTTIEDIYYQQVYAYEWWQHSSFDTTYYGAVREVNDSVWFLYKHGTVSGEGPDIAL